MILRAHRGYNTAHTTLGIGKVQGKCAASTGVDKGSDRGRGSSLGRVGRAGECGYLVFCDDCGARSMEIEVTLS